jgi:hypothetical protein
MKNGSSLVAKGAGPHRIGPFSWWRCQKSDSETPEWLLTLYNDVKRFWVEKFSENVSRLLFNEACPEAFEIIGDISTTVFCT